MNLRKSISLIFACWSAAAMAVTIDVTPGSLESLVGEGDRSMTDLTLRGSVNATDLHFVATQLRSLTRLDLSGATIAADNNARLATNRTAYPAGELPAYILSGASFSTIILPQSVTSIGDGALMSTPLTEVTIPAGVKTIGRGAFAGCRELNSVTVPATVTTVGDYAFDGCTGLKTVTYNATAIPEGAFRGCTSLSRFAGSVNSVGSRAFAGCTSLTDFPFTATVIAVGDAAFYASGLEEIGASGSKITAIGDFAFACCPSLKAVSLPATVKTIGKGAFFDDAAMSMLSMPASTESVADYALKGASSLTDGKNLLPEGVSSLGRYSLAGMTSVANLVLPSTLTEVSSHAMAGMTGLQEIDAKALTAVPATGEAAWEGVEQRLVSLYVDPELQEIFQSAPQWKEFSIVTSGTSTGIIADQVAADAVSAVMDAGILTVTATAPISRLCVYNVAGQLLEMRDGSDSTVSVDLSARHDRVFVVMAALENQSVVKTFKIAR